MRVVVTGAAGYVGVNLVNLLVADGHHVVAIDTLADQQPRTDSVTWAAGDVLDTAGLRHLFAGADRVYHLASKITLSPHDQAAWDLNTNGVASVAQAALDAGVSRLVHCSSVHAFDQKRCGPVLSESSPRTLNADMAMYDRSKNAGETRLHDVIEAGLDAVIVNPTGIFGPVDNPDRLSRLNRLIHDAARGRVPASVEGSFDFVDVRDVARGLIQAAEYGRTGENYLLPGNHVTIHHMLATAANVAGRRGPIAPVSLEVVRALLPLAEPIGRALGSDAITAASIASLAAAPRVDGSKARTELGYQPRPATETIRDMVAFLVHAGGLDRRKTS